MKYGLDAYTLNARLWPALLTILPAAWTAMAWSPGHEMGWGGLSGLFIASGGMVLLSQMARDRGKRKERALFDKFGGRPSERLLSHEFAPNNIVLAGRHAKLAALMPDVHIPTADEEAHDPGAAHKTYEACVTYLIGRTRDDRMLFQENISYGFRRNLWGLKPYGPLLAAACSLALGLRLYLESMTHATISPLIGVFEALNVAMLAAWLLWFVPAWVMIPARAYAERLLEALDRQQI
jgi:hypothetical protein